MLTVMKVWAMALAMRAACSGWLCTTLMRTSLLLGTWSTEIDPMNPPTTPSRLSTCRSITEGVFSLR